MTMKNDKESDGKKRKGMKKGVKITLVSLASLAAIAIIAIALLLWTLLTPERLTSVVNKLADKYITCETHFEKVDLSLFKTFPYLGLSVEGVNIINPMTGAPNDTVASIGDLTIGVNISEYLKHKNIELKCLELNHGKAFLYTNPEGNTNYDIFPHNDDTTSESEPFAFPELVNLHRIAIKNLDVTYVNDSVDIAAAAHDVDLSVKGSLTGSDTLLTGVDALVKLDVDWIQSQIDTALFVSLDGLTLKVDGKTKDKNLDGKVKLAVKEGYAKVDGNEYNSDCLGDMKGDLLLVEGKLAGDFDKQSFSLDDFKAQVKEYALKLAGDVRLPQGEEPMWVDMNIATEDKWSIKPLLEAVPAGLVPLPATMKIDGDVQLAAQLQGEVGDSLLPSITAHLLLDKGSFADKTLVPYAFNGIEGDVDAKLELNEGGISSVNVNRLKVCSGRNQLEAKGTIDDLMGRMMTDANISGTIFLADIKSLLPDTLPLAMEGRTTVDLHATAPLAEMADLGKARSLARQQSALTGDLKFSNVDVTFDTMVFRSPQASLHLDMPSKMKRGLFDELLSGVLELRSVSADMPNQGIDASIERLRIKPAISNVFDTTQPFRLVCDYDFSNVDASVDTMQASLTEPKGTFALLPKSKTGQKVDYKIGLDCGAMHLKMNDSITMDVAGLTLNGDAHYDPSKSNALQQWSPNMDIEFKRGYLTASMLDYVVQIPDIKFNYKPERCEIAHANMVFGNSDFYISGAVEGLEKWLTHEAMLQGDLYFTSNFTNVDDLMEALSGLGSDADTLEAQRKEDHVDTSAHPFIVPKDVDFTLHTRIKDAVAFDNELQEVAGDVRICDGIAVLNQVGFVCKAARMQLTGMYRTPRVNHIFVGLDFHLLDINIQELIDMIPYVDTLVPLLEDLEGAADFHLCAETYVDAYYRPKMSTLRAAAALTGQDLVVLDNKSVDRIAKLLQLKGWREADSKIHVDSLDVAMTVFRKELEVYPFLLKLHKYQIVAEGRHSLDQTYDYHVELVETPMPVRLAVDVTGKMPKLNFSLSPKLRYKDLYRPARRKDVDEEMLRLKALIRESLEKNVKESTRKYQGFKDENVDSNE